MGLWSSKHTSSHLTISYSWDIFISNTMFSWCCSFPQSPFPEFKGHFEKGNSHMTPGNVKTSLTFSDASPKSAPSAPIQSLKVSPVSLLRPGEVLEIQKQLTPQVSRQKKLTAENVSCTSVTSQITCDVTTAILKYCKYIEKLKLAAQAVYVQMTMLCTVYMCK